jgi:FixJ family two-component response regulator
MSRETPTVFVIDDDPSVRRSLARLIRAMGLEAETFAAANDFLRRQPFEGNGCIVLDLRMPGMTGLELQAALEGGERHPPIVFLTGHGDVPASVRAMKHGAVDFLQKPVEDDVLERAIRTAIERDRELLERHRRAREIHARIAALTPREREVMEHVIAGDLNKQCAARLGIAVSAPRGFRCLAPSML